MVLNNSSRTTFALLSFVLLSFALHSQLIDAGNGWIWPNVNYHRIVVEEDGVYRVTIDELAAAGYDTTNLDPAKLRLYHRGVEQYIFVKDSAGKMQWFEFVGRAADGGDDKTLFVNPALNGAIDSTQQTNPNRSLFTTESVYFLGTDTITGKRATAILDTNYSGKPNVARVRTKVVKNYEDSYGFGGGSPYDSYHRLNPDYTVGEGWIGPQFDYNNSFADSILTPRAHPQQGNIPILRTRIFGSSSWTHIYEVEMNGFLAIQDTRPGIHGTDYVGFVNPTIPAVSNFEFQAFGTDNNNTDENHVISVQFDYDHDMNLEGGNSLEIIEWPGQQDSLMLFLNAEAKDSCWLWDQSNGMRISGIASPGIQKMDLRLIVPGDPNTRDFMLVTDSAIKSVVRIEPSNIIGLSASSNQGEFLIIAGRALSTSATKYAAYRDTAVGGMVSRVVYTDEIYDEFGYGSPTPLAIKRFLMTALNQWSTPPAYALIWGKAKQPLRDDSTNIVPTWGFPASDWDYVSRYDLSLSDKDFRIPIGRVSIVDDQQGMDYLAKVDEYEHQQYASWMEEGVWAGGGKDTLEQKPIDNFLDLSRVLFEGPPINGISHTYYKYDTTVLTNSTKTMTQAIDDGVSWIVGFGHGVGEVGGVGIDSASNYTNGDRMPMVMILTGTGGDYSTDTATMGENWIRESQGGAICWIENTAPGYLSPLGLYHQKFFEHQFGQGITSSVGTSMLYADTAFRNVVQGQISSNMTRQMAFLGDPSIVALTSIATPTEKDLPSLDMIAYPNPADNFVTIRVDQFSQPLEVSVFDLMGRQLVTGMTSGGSNRQEFEWDLTENGRRVSPGTYFIRLKNGAHQGIAKVVVTSY